MGSEVEDPGLADLPDEAFEAPGEEGLSVPQLELRIRAKREQAMQDAGLLSPPGPDEPLEEPDEEPEELEEPEPLEPQEPEEPEGEADDEEFFFARYKTREEAERGKAEADATIDRLYRERAEWQQQQEQEVQGEQQFDPQAWNEWAAETVATGAGEQGALAALHNGGTQAYDIYLAHWAAEPDQLVIALAFNNDVQRHLATQHALAAVSPLIEEQKGRMVETEALRARATIASRHPDFDDLEQEMDRLVLEENGPLDADTKQWLEDTARTQGIPGKVRVLEYLYQVASQSVSPKRREAQVTEKRRRKAAADAARVSATVSSSEASGTRTPLSEAELAVLAKRNAIREKLGQPQIPTD